MNKTLRRNDQTVKKNILSADDIVCNLTIPLQLRYWKMIKASLEKDDFNIISKLISDATDKAQTLYKEITAEKGEVELDLYDEDFYDRIIKKYDDFVPALTAAVMHHIQPASVVDIGCGLGLYLSIFKNIGVDVQGFEGSMVAIDRSNVKDNIVLTDVSMPFLHAHDIFDLAISFEVAEHIPEDRTDVFLQNIISLSSTVLFSAARKGQRGDGHVNEQPKQYWIDEFEDLGYVYDEKTVGKIKKDIEKQIPLEKLQNIYPYENMMIFKYEGGLI